MSELLSSITGGSGSFTADVVQPKAEIAASSSGNLLVVVPPTGQRVVLTGLSSFGSTTETGITITFGARSVVNSLDLFGYGGTIAVGAFYVGGGRQVGSTNNPTGMIEKIEGRIGETMTIIKDTGSTVNVLSYSYATGE